MYQPQACSKLANWFRLDVVNVVLVCLQTHSSLELEFGHSFLQTEYGLLSDLEFIPCQT